MCVCNGGGDSGGGGGEGVRDREPNRNRYIQLVDIVIAGYLM